LRLATIHTRKRILPNEQKVIIQTKAENPEQFLIIVYFAVINSQPASFTLYEYVKCILPEAVGTLLTSVILQVEKKTMGMNV
jgi:hypothetical protein